MLIASARRDGTATFQHVRPGPHVVQRLCLGASELRVFAIGVLLALWAQASFEARRDADAHREIVAPLDVMLRGAPAVAAARVSTAACARLRIDQLDDALQSGSGDWTTMPAPELPETMRRGRIPPG